MSPHVASKRPTRTFLGEWKYGGQFYAVAFSRTGEFYAATHPKGVSLDEEFNVVKIDLASGKILGKLEFARTSLPLRRMEHCCPRPEAGNLSS
jgi:hypothetical protein